MAADETEALVGEFVSFGCTTLVAVEISTPKIKVIDLGGATSRAALGVPAAHDVEICAFSDPTTAVFVPATNKSSRLRVRLPHPPRGFSYVLIGSSPDGVVHVRGVPRHSEAAAHIDGMFGIYEMPTVRLVYAGSPSNALRITDELSRTATMPHNIRTKSIGWSGSAGSAVEESLGIPHNSTNAPDLGVVELKTTSSSFITLADITPDYGSIRDLGNAAFRKKYGRSRHSLPKVVGRYVVDSGAPTSGKLALFQSDAGPELRDTITKEVVAGWSWGLLDAKLVAKHATTLYMPIAPGGGKGWRKVGSPAPVLFGHEMTLRSFTRSLAAGLIHYDPYAAPNNARFNHPWRVSKKGLWDNPGLLYERYFFLERR